MPHFIAKLGDKTVVCQNSKVSMFTLEMLNDERLNLF
jgi:hypothetical protein